MKNQEGFTLAEMMIASVIFSLAALAFISFSSQTSKAGKSLQSQMSFNGDLRLFSNYIQTAISSGNLRFYGYTEDSIKYRLLVPIPGLCRNLSPENDCLSSTSLIYIKYDKTTSPAVSTICRFAEGPDEFFLVDLNNETYGPATLGSGGFNVGGMISKKNIYISSNKLIGLLDPPNAYVWRIVDAPVLMNYTQNSTTADFLPTDFPDQCKSNLQVDKVVGDKTFYKLDKLYKVKALPFALSQFVAGVNPPDLSKALLNDTIFPLRTFNVNIETVGLVSNAGKINLGVSKCSVTPALAIECLSGPGLYIDGINKFRVDEKFKISLVNSSDAIQSQSIWYELINNSQLETCTGGICGIVPLRLDQIDDIPILSTTNETATKLQNSSFSLLKQQEINILRLRYLRNKKEDFINVYIP